MSRANNSTALASLTNLFRTRLNTLLGPERPIRILLAVSGVLVLLTITMALAVRIEPDSSVEASTRSQIQSAGVVGTHQFMEFVSFLTGTSTRYVIIPFAVTTMWLAGLRRHSRNLLIGSLAVGTLAMLGDFGLGLVADRVRPFSGATELSFPSAHTYGTVLFFGVVTYLIFRHSLPKKFGLPVVGAMAVLTALVGPSRIYLDMHWPADVLAGYVYGMAALLLFIATYSHLERRLATIE